MHSKALLSVAILGFLLFGAQPLTRAQDATAPPKAPVQKQVSVYHLDIAINELEDGKKLNTRHYSMNLADTEGGGNEVKIGTRVPVKSEEPTPNSGGKFEYVDVGTDINARIVSWVTPLILDVTANISSFATPDEATHGGHPLLRNMRIGGSMALIPDKPTIVGSVDDPNSKRQFQLEVTATKLN
jgi:hypothetical protein